MTDMMTAPYAYADLRPGLLVVPGDEAWDAARQAWNLAVDQQPAAVALPATAEDVVAVVEYARDNGLRVAAQGTGHNASPLGSLDETVLVKTHKMRGVEIDPDAQVARVEAGALWIDVVEPAAEHGLVALSGSSPDVGVVGYTLGGGLSWLARRYGLASNRVLAIELVNADGELVRVDCRNDPDLFWALRGGGGNFGVVTALEMELIAIRNVYAGALFFPIERASEVLHAWREWTYTVPETATSVGRILRVPEMEEIPEPLRGGEFVIVEAIVLGDEAAAAELVAPLRALGPMIDTVATMPAPGLVRLHMDPEEPIPGAGDHQLLRELPAAAIDAVVELLGAGAPTQLMSYEIRHIGGAAGRALPGNGALAAIDAEYCIFAGGLALSADMADAVLASARRVREALAPWDAGREYGNFSEHSGDTARLYDSAAYDRLREIRARVDPDELFQANHEIRPA